MELPTNDDLARRMAEFARDAVTELGEETAALQADAARNGALGNSRLKLAYVKALDDVWRRTLDNMAMTAEQYGRHGVGRPEIAAIFRTEAIDLFDRLVAASRLLPKTGAFADPGLPDLDGRLQDSRRYMDVRVRDLETGVLDEPAEFGRLSDDLTLNGGLESSGTIEIRGTPLGIQTGAATIGTSALGVIPSDAAQSHNATSPTVTSRPPARALTWTGKLSPQEQVGIVRLYAPVALQGLDQLVAAIEAQRCNDEATEAALAALRDLRSAIDDLLRAADTEVALAQRWENIERSKDALSRTVEAGANIFAGQPVLTYGVASVISKLTNEPISAGLVATIYDADATRAGLVTSSNA